jgi:hypothetical protein
MNIKNEILLFVFLDKNGKPPNGKTGAPEELHIDAKFDRHTFLEIKSNLDSLGLLNFWSLTNIQYSERTHFWRRIYFHPQEKRKEGTQFS